MRGEGLGRYLLVQGDAVNLVARSEGVGVLWFAGNCSPTKLLQAVVVVEDGLVALLQDKSRHHVRNVRKED